MTAPCTVRKVEPFERKHLARDDRAAWWVDCRVCPPRRGSFIDNLFGVGGRRLGWAPTWATAIAFADAHASLHLDQACQTCRHVPEVEVRQEDTVALMQARA